MFMFKHRVSMDRPGMREAGIDGVQRPSLPAFIPARCSRPRVAGTRTT